VWICRVLGQISHFAPESYCASLILLISRVARALRSGFLVSEWIFDIEG
jgi:hypothetical protein